MNTVIIEDFRFVYSQTKSSWDKLQHKTILITGATGFFGKCMLQNFICANNEHSLNINIIALSRNPEKFIVQNPEFKHDCISWIKGDVKNFEFHEQNIDFIIHAATDVNTHLITNEPLSIYESIVDGTKHILELAKQKNTNSVLYISSGAVYGKQPHHLTHISEDYVGATNVYDKDASYGEGKRVAEMLCNIYNKQHQVDVKIARCYSFVGPYLPLNGHFAIGNFINDILHNRQIKIQGDGTPQRAYLYTADLMIWLLKILTEGKPCYPYNVGSDEAINLETLANIISQYSRSNLGVEIAQAKTSAPPAIYVPSIERAKNELGLKVFTNIKDAIDKTFKFNSK
ncbi:MAG: epimerase [Sphingobacteriaceae bacterium]|nr:epimerase [Sphingobacteriaceae bacterium]